MKRWGFPVALGSLSGFVEFVSRGHLTWNVALAFWLGFLVGLCLESERSNG